MEEEVRNDTEGKKQSKFEKFYVKLDKDRTTKVLVIASLSLLAVILALHAIPMHFVVKSSLKLFLSAVLAICTLFATCISVQTTVSLNTPDKDKQIDSAKVVFLIFAIFFSIIGGVILLVDLPTHNKALVILVGMLKSIGEVCAMLAAGSFILSIFMLIKFKSADTKRILKIMIYSICAGLYIFAFVSSFVVTLPDKTEKPYRCSVCRRLYENKEDRKSITRTGMCVQCKKNYDYAINSKTGELTYCIVDDCE